MQELTSGGRTWRNLKKTHLGKVGNIWLLSWDKPIQKFSLHHSHTGVLLSCVPKDEGEVNLEENHSLLREEKLSDENIDKTLFFSAICSFWCKIETYKTFQHTFSISNHPNLPFLDSSSTGLSTTLALESLLTGSGASEGALLTGDGAAVPLTAGGAAGGGWGGWGAPAGGAAVPFMTLVVTKAGGGVTPAPACAVPLLKNCAIPGWPGLKRAWLISLDKIKCWKAHKYQDT